MRKSSRIRVAVAGPNTALRSALGLLVEQSLGMRVVARAANLRSLFRRLDATQPDMILLDWDRLGASQDCCISLLRGHCLHAIVVALSGKPESRSSAIAAGADAFVDRGDSPTQLLETLQTLLLAPSLAHPPSTMGR